MEFTGITSPYEQPDSPEIHIYNGNGADISANSELIFIQVLNMITIKEQHV